MYEEKDYTSGTMIMAFLVGGLVGAGIALLTAPRTGMETRQKIKDLASDTSEKMKSATEEARLRMAETLSRGKSAASSAVEAGKKAMEEEKQRVMGS